MTASRSLTSIARAATESIGEFDAGECSVNNPPCIVMFGHRQWKRSVFMRRRYADGRSSGDAHLRHLRRDAIIEKALLAAYDRGGEP